MLLVLFFRCFTASLAFPAVAVVVVAVVVQIYVPVSNALGLGSSFRELEELGYKALFPQTYSNMALWHRDVRFFRRYYDGSSYGRGAKLGLWRLCLTEGLGFTVRRRRNVLRISAVEKCRALPLQF